MGEYADFSDGNPPDVCERQVGLRAGDGEVRGKDGECRVEGGGVG